ncbi:MAG TPA: cytochrome c oxidase assembly protein [Burkholderiales bacterium]|jgi:cytochrome c oxidase assembly protein subunit 11|nr:cytochrome c oxidase assembly protein [Burkholderiales bacterium]
MTLREQNRKLFARLALIAVAMFGFGYALVPLYYRVCEALGINTLGEVAAAPRNSQVDLARTVTIEFDANAHGLAFRFRPLVNHIDVHPGELATVEYEVRNDQPVAVTAQAVPSYGPAIAGEYFKKIECFCFTQQTLGPGESRRMPVVFVVDPKLPRDVTSIALSYTFFEVAGRGGKG